MSKTQAKGKFAEDLASNYLISQGLKLIRRNFNTRYGEIDIIMSDKQTIVFVEVRYRRDAGLVDGVTSIDWKKQRKLIRTAQFYLQQNKINVDTSARFDIISITCKHNQPVIDWVKNAFQA